MSSSLPGHLHWRYDAAEMRADAVVHVVGVLSAIAGAIVLGLALDATPVWQTAGVVVYMASLVAALSVSAAYNMWPTTRIKWILRRLDHSMIYVFIAGTYTPFIVKAGGSAWILLGVVWAVACAGVVLKMAFPGRFDRLSIVAYLALGWSGAALYQPLTASLSPAVLVMIAAGGVVYSAGVVFHLWRGLRFQNAIWHCFVLAGAACHYGAVLRATALVHAG